MIGQQPQGAVLRIGKVVKVHASDHSVDMVMMDNGARMANVQVLAPTASTRSGRVDLPEPELPDASNPWSLEMSGKQDILAVAAFIDGMPLVLGFLYPQANQLAMPEDTHNLKIERHASDYYEGTDDKANHSQRHPGGAYISIGTPIAVADGSDFDKLWKTERNKTGAAVTLHSPGDSTVTLDGGTISEVASGLISLKAPRIELN